MMMLQVMEGGKGVTFNCINAAMSDEAAPPPAAGLLGASVAAVEGTDPSTTTTPSTAAAPAPSMVLHALRLRPSENQEHFLRLMNENKSGSNDGAATKEGHWVPPF